MSRSANKSDSPLQRRQSPGTAKNPLEAPIAYLGSPPVYRPFPTRTGGPSASASAVLRKAALLSTPLSVIPSRAHSTPMKSSAPPPYRPVRSVVVQPRTGGHQPGLAPSAYRPNLGLAALKLHGRAGKPMGAVDSGIQHVPVPTRPIPAGAMIQRMNGKGEEEFPSSDPSVRWTISGHGAIKKGNLEPAIPGKRELKHTFSVPKRVTLTIYAPPGAGLEDRVGNEIEKGHSLSHEDLVLKPKSGQGKTSSLPAEYPKKHIEGQEAINYTVSNPTGLKVEANERVYTIQKGDGGKSLKKIIDELIKGHPGSKLEVHYACCGSPSCDYKAEVFTYKHKFVDLSDDYIEESEAASILLELSRL